MKGNDLKAYFEGQAVHQIDVAGNAESIFYPLEKDGAKVGMNETKSGFLTIWVKDNKLDKLKIWPSPVGSMTPIPDLKPDQKMLKDFYWFDYLRPKNRDCLLYTSVLNWRNTVLHSTKALSFFSRSKQIIP